MKITTAAATFFFAMLMMTNTVRAASPDLKTQEISELGLSLSSYKYQEPGLMSLEGTKFGLDFNATNVLQNDNFIRGDLRFAFGSVDYTSNGTGSASGLPDWYIEGRVLFGTDWSTKDSVFSPYTGLGYRYLFNDARGISSNGASGYRRESNYIYLPVGVIHRTTFQDRSKLISTLEYDHLLAGKQVTSLSDVPGAGYSDFTNTQGSGYGLKLSIMYENDNGAIGPYVHYWNIDQSDMTLVYRFGVPNSYWVEPKNNTVEFGLKVSQQF
jgi:hypothetical protein